MTDYIRVGETRSLSDTRPKEGDNLKTDINLQNIKKYAAAESSLMMEGPVPPKVFLERKASCMSCVHRKEDPADEIGFCKACGCGRTKRAALTVKLTMPKASCPKDRWGQAKGMNTNPIKRLRVALGKRLLGIKDA